MRKVALRIVCLALVLAGMTFLPCIHLATAQDKQAPQKNTAAKLQDVVVTGTRSERAADEIVAQVSVVDSEEIRDMPVTTWDDVLKYQSGIYVEKPRDLSALSSMNMPTIRGMGGAGNNLLLLDGFPMMNPVSGWLTGNSVPSGLISRVEVVKGPNSSLYGSSAMGGVMNIITKNAKGKKWETDLKGRYGNYGYWEAGGDAANDFGAGNISMGYLHREADNYKRRDKDGRSVLYPGAKRAVTVEHDVQNVYTRADMVHVRGSWDINPKNKVNLIALANKAKQGGGWSTYVENLDKYSKEDDFFVGIRSNHSLGNDFDLSLGLYTNYVKADRKREDMLTVDGTTSYFPDEQKVTGQEFGFQAKLLKPLAKWCVATLGADFSYIKASWEYTRLDNGETFTDVSKSINNIAPYLQLETSFFDSRLLITPGIRADFHSQAGNAVSPKLGVRYNFTKDLAVRASVGRAFRAPTIRELYMPAWMMRAGVPFMGNEEVEPATLWSGDLGVEYRFLNRVRIDLAAFYSKGKDFISAPVVDGIQQYVNLDEVEIKGFEAGIRVQVIDGLQWFGNYTYTDAKDTIADEALDDAPQNVFNTGVYYNRDLGRDFRLMGSLILNYYTRMPYSVGMGSSASVQWESRELLDGGLTLGYRDFMTIGVKATNITNSKSYADGLTYGTGRAYWVEVGFTF